VVPLLYVCCYKMLGNCIALPKRANDVALLAMCRDVQRYGPSCTSREATSIRIVLW